MRAQSIIDAVVASRRAAFSPRDYAASVMRISKGTEGTFIALRDARNLVSAHLARCEIISDTNEGAPAP